MQPLPSGVSERNVSLKHNTDQIIISFWLVKETRCICISAKPKNKQKITNKIIIKSAFLKKVDKMILST